MFEVTLISLLKIGATGAVLRVDDVALGTGAFFDAASVVTDLDPDFDPRGAARRDCVQAMAGLFLVQRDATGGRGRRNVRVKLRPRPHGEGRESGCGEKPGCGDEDGAVPCARIGVTEQACLRRGDRARGRAAARPRSQAGRRRCDRVFVRPRLRAGRHRRDQATGATGQARGQALITMTITITNRFLFYCCF